jgi:hypothetical protein
MYASPTCPPLTAGRPFIQLDHARACWATEALSPSGLRAWLRLLTHFRNDRAIPRLSARRLAQIAGLSLGAAHRVLKELSLVLVFSSHSSGPQDGDATGTQPQLSQASRGCSTPERVQNLNAPPRSKSERKRSKLERSRSKVEHPSISLKEENQERKNPPPTSSSPPAAAGACGGHDEEERSLPVHVSGKQASNGVASQPPNPTADSLALHPQLAAVAVELRTYWAGKRGSRSPLAFAALQAQLLQIAASPIGGIEAVREQLQTAAMKDWDFIRYQTWQEWRTLHPPPLQLSESDLSEGGLFPGLRAFERRYRATYGKHARAAEVLTAFHNYKARLEREGSLREISSD